MKQHDIDLDLSRPQVMAILNVTPDSFFAGSRMPDATHVERRVKEAAAEGASIIDVGAIRRAPAPTKSLPTRSGGAWSWASGPCGVWRPAS